MINLPPLVEMIGRLVAQPSVSSADPALDLSNKSVIDLLATWYTDAGFDVLVEPLGNAKFNMIATRGDPDQGGGLVLAGHTDTVPYDAPLWSSNPFILQERDDRLYGLGTADMKSFFVLALMAAKTFAKEAFVRPLRVVATADEESSMAGARAVRDSGHSLGRYLVIGEPTGLKPIRAHKGVMMESLRIEGLAGHSSDPGLGANAIDGMFEAVHELLMLRDEWQRTLHNAGFKVAHPTLNFGSVRGGDNPNRICGCCELTFDIRLLPGMRIGQVRETIRDRLKQRMLGRPRLQWALQPLFEGVEPFEVPADAELVRLLEEFTGVQAETVAFGTEAPIFAELGLETVVLGAGDIEQAHQANEFIALAQIGPAIRLYADLIRRFCIEPFGA